MTQQIAGHAYGFHAERTDFYAFPACGSFLGVSDDGVLLHCPMNADGTPDKENIGGVENAEGIDFADVNAVFGTSFSAADFGGR